MRNKALAAIIALLCARPLFACSVVIDWVSQGGQRVNVGAMNSSNYFMRSYPGATINVYTVGTSTPVTIYSNSACSSVKSQPFSADATSFMQFYVSVSQVDVVVSGGGLTGSRRTTYTPSPVQGSFITQAEADARYLPLTGGTLAGTGNLLVGGTLGVTGAATFSSAASFTNSTGSGSAIVATTSNASNTTSTINVVMGANVAAVGLSVHNAADTTGFDFLTSGTLKIRGGNSNLAILGQNAGSSLIEYGSIAAGAAHWWVGESLGAAGQQGNYYISNQGTAGTNAVLINSATNAVTLAAGLTGTTAAFSGALTSTSSAHTGLISGSAGLTISAGATSLQACTTTTLNATTGTFSGALSGTSATLSTTLGVTGLLTGTTATLSGLLTTNGGIADKNGIGSITPLANTLSIQSNQVTAAPVAAVQVVDPNATVPFDYRFGVYGGLAGSDWMILDNIAVINRFNLAKATGNVTIGSGTTAQLGIGQAPTARLVAGQGGVGVQPEEIRVDAGSGAGGDAYISMFRNGVVKGLVGISGAANNLITGSAANDMNFRNAQAMNWSANGSAAIQMSLTSGGFLGIGTTAGFPLHVVSTTSPQFISSYDATHRVGVWHDNTNGYSGTTTNQPYILRTNNTDAVTVTTGQFVGVTDSAPLYPLSVKKDGTSAMGGNVNSIVTLQNTAGTNGLYLGTGGGANAVIGALGTSNGVQIYVNDAGVFRAGIQVTSTGYLSINRGISSILGSSTLAGAGVAALGAKVDLTAQAASIGSTSISTGCGACANQIIRLCWVQTITRAATTSSSIITTLGWTDSTSTAHTSTLWTDWAAGTTGTTADASNTVGSSRGNCIVIDPVVAVAGLTYATTYSTTGATTMQYALRIRVIHDF